MQAARRRLKSRKLLRCCRSRPHFLGASCRCTKPDAGGGRQAAGANPCVRQVYARARAHQAPLGGRRELIKLGARWPSRAARHLHHLVWVEDALWVHRLFQCRHQLDGFSCLRKADDITLFEADAVLRGDGSANVAGPLPQPRLQRIHDVLFVLGARDVQVQIAISHVAKTDHSGHAVVALEALSGVLHHVIQLRQRQRNVVLVHVAVVLQGLGDSLADVPDRPDFGWLRRHRAVVH
mmetsp:Transcript_25934/g.78065  ORF Transcript_25934/g.78065 Transcript_25934/m.78065 type:complete len:237 (-) Transcript_25934:1236-1946(-)